MINNLYRSWSRSAFWILTVKQPILKVTPELNKLLINTIASEFSFADLAEPLLQCYSKSIEWKHLIDDDTLGKHVFNLAKPLNELSGLDLLLMQTVHGRNTVMLFTQADDSRLTRQHRSLKLILNRYLVSRSPELFIQAMEKLAIIERRLLANADKLPKELLDRFESSYNRTWIGHNLDFDRRVR